MLAQHDMAAHHGPAPGDHSTPPDRARGDTLTCVRRVALLYRLPAAMVGFFLDATNGS